jgi:hypothetical protein
MRGTPPTLLWCGDPMREPGCAGSAIACGLHGHQGNHADGSVVKSYPKALDHSNPQRDPPPDRKYLRYTTTRQLELADLYAVDESLARSNTFFDRLSMALRVPAWVGLVGVVLALFALPVLGVSGTVATVVLAVSIPLVVVGVLGVVFLPGLMRRRFERVHVDGGLESSTPEVLKEPEAKALIDTRSTGSGSPSDEGR